MLGALNHVPAQARISILNTLRARGKSEDLTNLYLTAALYDPSPLVRTFARRSQPNLQEHKLDGYKERVVESHVDQRMRGWVYQPEDDAGALNFDFGTPEEEDSSTNDGINIRKIYDWTIPR